MGLGGAGFSSIVFLKWGLGTSFHLCNPAPSHYTPFGRLGEARRYVVVGRFAWRRPRQTVTRLYKFAHLLKLARITYLLALGSHLQFNGSYRVGISLPVRLAGC